MKKKTRAKILITGYEDPVNGCTCDISYDGEEAEIVALLFRCAIAVCNEINMTDDEIRQVFINCVPGDQDV